MIAIMTGRPLRFPGTILMLVIASASVSGQSLAASDPYESEPYNELLDQIENAEVRGGPNSPELIEPLTSLGLFHQERDEHQMAIAAYARARAVIRVNNGFSTLQEVLVMRQMTESLYASGDVMAAWDYEQNMLRLAQAHVGDIATLPIYLDVVARRSEVLSQYRAGGFPAEMILGCYYSQSPHIRNMMTTASAMGPSSCTSGSRRAALGSLLREIGYYQSQAMEALLRNDLHSSDELEQLVYDVIRNSEELQSVQPYGDRGVGSTLNRVFTNVPGDTGTMLRLTELYVHIADFNLRRMHRNRSYSNYDHISNQYKVAFTRMNELGVEQAEINEFFSPTVPVLLPAFDSNAFVAITEEPPTGDSIDVAFDITRYGRAERVQILNTNGNPSRTEVRNLTRLIEGRNFRPRMVDGEFPERTRVFARYLFNPTQG
jgi:hypothetical protein